MIKQAKPTARISRLTFKSGQEISINSTDKVLIVGPNNSGKSLTLREILQIVGSEKEENTRIVGSVQIEKSGSLEHLEDFLRQNARYDKDGFYFRDWHIPEHQVRMWRHERLPYSLAKGFIRLVDASERLRICEQQPNVAPEAPKSKPQQVLYDDAALMERVSRLFFQAFGQHLMINFRGGSVIPIHVGMKPDEHLVDRAGDDYVAAVRQNPTLHTQGDGVRSYAGILFETIVSDLDIALVDEPEAFLHPPQMRKIGFTLASEVEGQLFVASHSSDVLRGFLEGTKGDVRILLIRRAEGLNLVFEAPPDAISELWQRPELRYSNALEGVFHDQSIICEDDSDCRLFNAVADYLSTNDASVWPDTSYIPAGGKHGVKKIASVMRRIGVPIKAVFDIDILSDRQLLQETIEAFGADWADFEVLWKRLDAAVRAGIPVKTAEEIKMSIVRLIQDSEPDILPKKAIRNEFNQSTQWSQVKEYGAVAVPRGNAQGYLSELCSKLASIGIYVVMVGEVEKFFPDIGNHGPTFVVELLSTVPLGDKRLSALREFVEQVHKGPAASVTQV